jgi:hypothetical protein
MRRAGDVCFAQVFRDGSGKNLQINFVFSCPVFLACCFRDCVLRKGHRV